MKKKKLKKKIKKLEKKLKKWVWKFWNLKDQTGYQTPKPEVWITCDSPHKRTWPGSRMN